MTAQASMQHAGDDAGGACENVHLLWQILPLNP
jgi:hypothetical protein